MHVDLEKIAAGDLLACTGAIAVRSIDRAVMWVCAACMMLRRWRAVRIFRRKLGRLPRISPPDRKNDKFFWRKIIDHNPLFEIFCDKLACKEWVATKCPDLAIPRTIWQGSSARDIPDELLVSSVIVKASAGCGYNIVPDGAARNRQYIEKKFARWLEVPYGWNLAEWGYQNVPRRVFVEELIGASSGEDPDMIHVYSVLGEPVCFQCVIGRKDGQRSDAYYSPDGERLQLRVDGFDPIPNGWRPPSGIGKALQFTRTLGRGLDNIRCDFMCIGDRVWFSEMTPYSGSGHSNYADPSHGDGAYKNWDIRRSWFLTTPQTGWKRIYAAALLRQLANYQPT